MRMISDETLLEEIQIAIKANPRLIGPIQEICAKTWSEYVSYLEAKKNRDHVNSLSMMISGINLKNRKRLSHVELICFLDAVIFLFPEGFHCNMTKAEINFLNFFVKSAKFENWRVEDVWHSRPDFAKILETLYQQTENGEWTS